MGGAPAWRSGRVVGGTVFDPFKRAPFPTEGAVPSYVPVDDPVFREARRQIVEPPPAKSGGLVTVALFVLFVLTQMEGLRSLPGIGLLAAVLLVHEGGHALGMWMFGFRDLRMFFIPFLGAAVHGRPHGAAAWKEALVSLLGPVPGVIVGVAGTLALARSPHRLLLQATQIVLMVNLFNLLPLGSLDGGRFLQRVLFSRHRVLEVGFLAVGSALLCLLAYEAGIYAILIFAALGLVVLPYRYRLLGAAAELRREVPGIPADPSLLDGQAAWALYQKAWRLHGAGRTRRRISDTMTAILEATKPPPGGGAAAALLALYGASVVIGLAALVELADLGHVRLDLRSRAAQVREPRGFPIVPDTH